MVALDVTAVQHRDGSDLTPYQHTASPAASVQPAAVTESETDSDWWERQLPAAACRSNDSAVLRRGAHPAAKDSRAAAARAIVEQALADAGHDTVAMSDADTEPLDDSDAEPEAEAAVAHRDGAGAARGARGGSVLADHADAVQDSLCVPWQLRLPG